MRALGLKLAVLVLVAVLASGAEVLAVRIPAAFAETSNRVVSPAEQPRELAEGGNTVVVAADFDASVKPAATTATTGSSPSMVLGPDRMSKRRVRRGSDPIHNKYWLVP
ncbi:hypothetical protein ABZP36_007451 [Zizania latifolia]